MSILANLAAKGLALRPLRFFSAYHRGLARKTGQHFTPENFAPGKVYLIGAGPGDPELLTLKAWRLMQQADVILYDWLISPDMIAALPKKAQRVFVGKRCGHHSMTQENISHLMVEFALQGKVVVRLKGGDPAIFARAAEECLTLERHQIPFAIVPGVTAASGASAYSGIFLTHRDCAQSVRYVTAHQKNDEHQTNWQFLAQSMASQNETLVIYMGLTRLQPIMEQLQRHGVCVKMPVAVIDQATCKQQLVCKGNLGNIASLVAQNPFQGPALIIVGEVVNKATRVDLSLLAQSRQERGAYV